MAKVKPITQAERDDPDHAVVIFRKWRSGGKEVFALFPEIYASEGSNGQYYLKYCLSYQHLGQHGSAWYEYCIRASRPAKPEEYAELKRELESIGYKLSVRQRLNSAMYLYYNNPQNEA